MAREGGVCFRLPPIPKSLMSPARSTAAHDGARPVTQLRSRDFGKNGQTPTSDFQRVKAFGFLKLTHPKGTTLMVQRLSQRSWPKTHHYLQHSQHNHLVEVHISIFKCRLQRLKCGAALVCSGPA